MVINSLHEGMNPSSGAAGSSVGFGATLKQNHHHHPSSICHYESSWFTLVTFSELHDSPMFTMFSCDFLRIFRIPKLKLFPSPVDKRLQEHCERQGHFLLEWILAAGFCCGTQTHLFSLAAPTSPFQENLDEQLHPSRIKVFFFPGWLRTSASGTFVPSPKIRARAWSIKMLASFPLKDLKVVLILGNHMENKYAQKTK